MTVFVAQLFSGISVGSILLLVALGPTFTFGQMGVLNMAHGELIMAGAYTTYMLQGPLGNDHLGLSLLVSLVVAFFVAGTIGVIVGGIIPPDDQKKLRELGVRECFGPGTSIERIVEFLSMQA